MDGEAWRATVHRVAKSQDTTEWLNMHAYMWKRKLQSYYEKIYKNIFMICGEGCLLERPKIQP